MDQNTYRKRLTDQLNGSEVYFSGAEFAARRARLADAMTARGFDALLLSDPSDIHYICGYKTFELSVHTVLVFTPQHSLLQVAGIETGPAVTTAQVDDIIGYRWESPDTVIEPLLAALGPHSAIGVDLWAPGLRPGVLDALRAGLGAERLQPMNDTVDAVRLIKSDAEIDCLRASARMTRIGLDAAVAAIQPGASENDIAAAGAQAMLAAGSEFMSLQPIVTSGTRSSVIHLNHQNRMIQQNEPVFLEFGAVFQRYTAPMMQTVITGQPDSTMTGVQDLCAALYHCLITHMRPGATFHDAARAANAILAEQADDLFFSGVFGYSVGTQFPPSWVEGTGFIAEGQMRHFASGMVFHLPLCLRRPGQWGIGLSNTVVVDADTTRPLTDNDFSLQVCPV